MPLVLALEPDLRQAGIIKRVIREQVNADLVLVDSRDAAIAALNSGVPDVVLLTALLSPRDEEELITHLRALPGAEHLQTHTIPQLASAGGSAGTGRHTGLLGKFRRGKKDAEPIAGCDPDVFADEVRAYLRRAAELKIEAASAPHGTERGSAFHALASARLGEAVVTDVTQQAPAPPPVTDSWSSPFEWRRSPAQDLRAVPAERLDEPFVEHEVVGDVASAFTRRSREAQDTAREAERERQRLEAEAAAQRERMLAEAEAAAAAERERLRLEAEAAAAAERERLRVQAEAEAAAERERLRLEAEAEAAAERERLRLQAEAEAAAERERLRLEAEAEAAAERERLRLQAEAEAAAERERLRLQAEAEAAAERERLRAEAEAEARRERERLEREAAAERERLLAEAAAEAERERQRLEEEAAAERERLRVEMEAEIERERAARAAAEPPPEPEPPPDAFAEFRLDDEEEQGIFKLMPIAAWTRRIEVKTATPSEPQPGDALRELMSGLLLPPPVASMTYPRGCRIRRVRVPPAAVVSAERDKRPVIVSRRALQESRR